MSFKKGNVIAQERPVVACAHEGCPNPAILSLKSANLCRNHYELHISQEARDFAGKMGLITRSQKREFCLAHMKHPLWRERGSREPGQDDECAG